MTFINILSSKATILASTYKLLLVLYIAIGFSSCSKDVLDKSPSDRFSDDAVWKDISLTTAFVDNAYRLMPSGFNNLGSIGIFASCVDEFEYKGGNFQTITMGNLSSSNLAVVNDFWGSTFPSYFDYNFYTVITKCNIFFSNIDASPIEETVKNRLIGEMNFLRGYSYFKLAALYGGVPLIKTPFELTDNLLVPRNTFDECMTYAISEFDKAASLLPLPTEVSASELGRVTKGAALAAKSRALLYMASPLNNPSNNLEKWEAAADAAKAVIELNLYSLFPDYQGVFLNKNSWNSEVIWAKAFDATLTGEPEAGLTNVELFLYSNGHNGYAHVVPYHDFVDSYEMLNGKLPKDDPAYDLQNPYINRDPRFYMSILFDGALFKGREMETFLPGGLDSRDGINPSNSTLTGYFVRKFIDESITNPSGKNTANPPWIYFRYAETLLNYAEAKYFLGDEGTCREYLNLVRSRPGVNMPPVTESGAALLSRLQNERKIELAFEDHRWFDIRRWKIAPAVMTTDATRMDISKDPSTGIKTYTVNTMFTRGWKDADYLWPVPLNEIQKNSLLIQNPGY